MRTMRNVATLAAVTLSMTFSLACTRTRTVTRFVPVVQRIDVCPVTAPELPPLPVRSTCLDSAMELCYEQSEAWRLAALLEALIDLHADVSACDAQAAVTEVTP